MFSSETRGHTSVSPACFCGQFEDEQRKITASPSGIHTSTLGASYPSALELKMAGLDESQVRRAAGALLKHVQKSTAGKPNLLEDEGEVILAQVSLHKIPGNVTAKPMRLAIPHPLRRQDDCDMCLIVKDNAKAWVKEMVEKEPVEGLSKIIKLEKLRSQYKDFKDKRQLLSQFDLFLADDRILPMLTKALGKTFLKVKKQPIPVRLERKSSLAAQISRARDSAFLCGSFGDCWAVKLANTAMTEDQVVENLVAGIAAVVDKIPNKWRNVKAINIKCSNSVALPVYSNVGDIPLAPRTSTAMVPAEKVEKESQEKVNAQKKRKRPRPLIRQQLNKLKEEAKAEAAAAEAADGKAKSKKRSASENVEPSVTDDDGGEDEEGGVKGKRKSPKLAKAAKRRRSAVA